MAAGDDFVKFGEFLVAAMVAAFEDELARDVELLPRLFLERPRSVGLEQTGDRWLGSTRPASGAKASRSAKASRARSRAMSHR